MLSKKYEQAMNALAFRGAFCFLLLLAVTYSLDAAGGAFAAGEGSRRFLGLQVGTISSPLGEEDPFAFPLGAGLFFEAHPALGGARLCWGASSLYYRFRTLDAEFEDSFMVQAGLFAGFDIPCLIDGEPAAALTPFVGFKQYYREYRFRGERIRGCRGVAALGARMSLLVAGALLIGFDLEYNILLEEAPLKTWACYQRLGVGF